MTLISFSVTWGVRRALENLIGDITCSADSVGPKTSRSLIAHRASSLPSQLECGYFVPHLFSVESHVGKKIADQHHAQGKTNQKGISELGPIVTVSSFQTVGMLIVQPQSQAPKVFKHFILTFQEENPRVMRIVINDDKNIPLATHVVNPRGTDRVHME
jgi:hypothetical protein